MATPAEQTCLLSIYLGGAASGPAVIAACQSDGLLDANQAITPDGLTVIQTAEIAYLQQFNTGRPKLSGQAFRACIQDGYIYDASSTGTHQWTISTSGLQLIGALPPDPTTGVTPPATGTSPGDTGTILNQVGILDSATISDTVLSALHAQNVSALDMAYARSRASFKFTAGGIIADKLVITGLALPATMYHLARVDSGRLADQLGLQLSAVLMSALRIDHKQAVTLALRMRDALKLSAVLGSQALLSMTTVDMLMVADVLVPAYAKAVLDRARITWSGTVQSLVQAQAMDEALMLDGLTPVMRAVVVEDDTLTIDDATLLRMIYQGFLVDGIEVLIDIAEPAGGLTAWAMNARAGHVSEYTNWTFNSYARFGDRYVGASVDGLFELVGDRDQTTPIASVLRGGMLELAGSMLAGLKAAYLAVRGEGEMYLKLEGGNRSTIYKVQLSTMRTSRVELGKGWRSRYLTWELITTGQDFDLAGLEFLPIQSTRRVGR